MASTMWASGTLHVDQLDLDLGLKRLMTEVVNPKWYEYSFGDNLEDGEITTVDSLVNEIILYNGGNDTVWVKIIGEDV